MFCAYMSPTMEEQRQRSELIEKCRSLVTRLYPEATLEVFGSVATKMYLPVRYALASIIVLIIHNLSVTFLAIWIW